MDTLIYDIWLSLAITPDSSAFKKLLSTFSDSKSIYEAHDGEIRSILGRESSEAQRLCEKALSRAREIYDFCKSKGVGLLSYFDEAFPENLRNIPTPPVLLYYRGVLPDFNNSFCAAVVGTRSISSYGRKNAFNIAYDLTKAGAVIVAGMALGIDGIAAAAALSAGGKTVAVLGSGIDVCYPPVHKTLARAIVKSGCVFTEYAPGTRPDKQNFPRRNRIISGLCEATLIIEGPERSGVRFTAKHAFKQNRAVYALPGNIENSNSKVCNSLLKNGARALTGADDIIRDFEDKYPSMLNPFALANSTRPKLEDELRKYSVSAVAPEDEIFSSKPIKRIKENSPKIKNFKAQKPTENKRTELKAESAPVSDAEISPVGFDAATLKIYKKIPMKDSCLIESLVDENFTLRDVMKALLKLEMGRFIKMLPGERVSRNL